MARDPRVRSFVLVAVMGISVLAGIAAIHSELDENTRNIIACISIAVVIVGFILHQILVRCPHCGRWIRNQMENAADTAAWIIRPMRS